MEYDIAIQRLASVFHQQWSAEGRTQVAFTASAVSALAEVDLSPLKDVAGLVKWIHSSDSFPEQIVGENEYGEPTVTLYRDADIRIEAILWMGAQLGGGGHDHKSRGAFIALKGARLQSHYRYACTEQFMAGVEAGEVSVSTEVLREGAIQPIGLLHEFIHELFFLERPSVSISLRSQVAVPGSALYFLPGLRLDRGREQLLRKRTQLGPILREVHGERLVTALSEIVREGPIAAIHACATALGGGISGAAIDAVGEACAALHGELGKRLSMVLREEVRRRDLQKALAMLRTPEERLFLGLLWSATGLERARSLMQGVSGTDAAPAMVRRCAERAIASDPKVFGAAWSASAADTLGALFGGLAPSDIVACASAQPSLVTGLRDLRSMPAFSGWVQ